MEKMLKIITPSFDPADGGIQALSKTIKDYSPPLERDLHLLMNWKYWAVKPNRRYSLYIHGLDMFPVSTLQKTMLTLLLKYIPPSKVIYVSALTRRTVEEKYPTLKNIPSRIIYNPIPNYYFTSHKNTCKKEKLILTVCRAVPRKNLEVAFNAFRKLNLHKKGWRYVHVGGGPLLNKLRADFPDIEFQGRISEGQKIELLGQASIFLHPNIKIGNDFEGFGLAPVEAIAFDAIPIFGEICGLAELIEDGRFKTDGSLPNVMRRLKQSVENTDEMQTATASLKELLCRELDAVRQTSRLVEFLCE